MFRIVGVTDHSAPMSEVQRPEKDLERRIAAVQSRQIRGLGGGRNRLIYSVLAQSHHQTLVRVRVRVGLWLGYLGYLSLSELFYLFLYF